MASKIFVLCFLVIAAEAAPKLGSESCTWGPAFWCQNYEQAKGCNALEHCSKKVWPQQVENNCDTCQKVMEKVEAFLTNKTDDATIIKLLEQACDTLGPFAQPCKAAVDANAQKIIDSLAGLVADPFSACAALNMCVFKDKPVSPRFGLMPGPVIVQDKKPIKAVKKAPKLKDSPTCELCEFAMNELEEVLSDNSTQEEIKNALESVCNMLPATIRDECNELVNQYEEQILDLLINELKNPKEICTLLSLCTAKPVHIVGNAETCEICKLAIGYLKAQLSQNATEEEIKQLLDKLCSYLPSSISSECDALISEYYDAIIQLLLQELDPDQVCTELGLCTSAAKCHLGASYWCRSKAHAVACKAVHHCSTFVWK